jgi:periplasmic protein TonB
VLHVLAFAVYVVNAPAPQSTPPLPLKVSLKSVSLKSLAAAPAAPQESPPPDRVAMQIPRPSPHPKRAARHSPPAPVTPVAEKTASSWPAPVVATPPSPVETRAEVPAAATGMQAIAPVPASAPATLEFTAPRFDARYLDNPAPPYPALAQRYGEQGRVLLRVLVSPGGGAEEVQVRDSSGFPRLDEVARETVRHWRFVPARRGTEPVPAWVLVPVAFQLKG